VSQVAHRTCNVCELELFENAQQQLYWEFLESHFDFGTGKCALSKLVATDRVDYLDTKQHLQ